MDLGDVLEGVNGTAGLMLNQALMKEPPFHEDRSMRQMSTKAEVAGTFLGDFQTRAVMVPVLWGISD